MCIREPIWRSSLSSMLHEVQYQKSGTLTLENPSDDVRNHWDFRASFEAMRF